MCPLLEFWTQSCPRKGQRIPLNSFPSLELYGLVGMLEKLMSAVIHNWQGSALASTCCRSMANRRCNNDQGW